MKKSACASWSIASALYRAIPRRFSGGGFSGRQGVESAPIWRFAWDARSRQAPFMAGRGTVHQFFPDIRVVEA